MQVVEREWYGDDVVMGDIVVLDKKEEESRTNLRLYIRIFKIPTTVSSE